MKDGILVRETTIDDLAETVLDRRAMFKDVGAGDSAALDPMASASGPYLQATIAQDCYRGWFARDGSAPGLAGGVGILLQSSPPRPGEVQSRPAYLLNLWVSPKHRAARASLGFSSRPASSGARERAL
jgi:hypothetical protein